MPKYLDGAGLSHFWESIKPKLGGVVQSGSGTVITSDDAANLPPLFLTIHGKSVQDGTPSPSSPVEIQSVEGRNLLVQPYATSSKTQNGVTFTVNADYSLTIRGTATAATYFNFANHTSSNPYEIEAGTYTLGMGIALPTGVSVTMNRRVGSSNLESYTINAGSSSGTRTFTASGILRCYITVASGATVDTTIYPMLERGSTAHAYQPYGSISLVVGSNTTYIDLQGNALRSLPDGTEDVLVIDGEGNKTLTQRIGLTTTATTDGITATVGTDAMSTTGTLADGATVIYKLASEQTISLGKIDLPSLPSPSFSMHVDALVTPTLDAEWFTEGGGKVIDFLQAQVPEREVLYDTSTWTVIRYGRTVMVQVHGATATPSTSTALITGILADFKPAYNCSATVLTSSGSSTQAARMAVYADTGNVYIVPAGYSSSASWYGTLTYIY